MVSEEDAQKHEKVGVELWAIKEVVYKAWSDWYYGEHSLSEPSHALAHMVRQVTDATGEKYDMRCGVWYGKQ